MVGLCVASAAQSMTSDAETAAGLSVTITSPKPNTILPYVHFGCWRDPNPEFPAAASWLKAFR